jgi:hypothetical protein
MRRRYQVVLNHNCNPQSDVARSLPSPAASCIVLCCRVWGKLFEAAAAAKADFDAASLTAFLWAANTAGAHSAAAAADARQSNREHGGSTEALVRDALYSSSNTLG